MKELEKIESKYNNTAHYSLYDALEDAYEAGRKAEREKIIKFIAEIKGADWVLSQLTPAAKIAEE